MITNFALFDLGTTELLIILLIVLLLFGSKKLPELSRSLGESVKEIRKSLAGTAELKDEVKKQVDETKTMASGRTHKP